MNNIPHAFEGAFMLGCLALTGFTAFLSFSVHTFLTIVVHFQQVLQDDSGNGLKMLWDLLN